MKVILVKIRALEKFCLCLALAHLFSTLAQAALPASQRTYSIDKDYAENAESRHLASRGLASTITMPKPQVIAKLKDIQKSQVETLVHLDHAIKKRMQDTMNLNLKGTDNNALERNFRQFIESVEVLQKRRAELIARREFIDQLIFRLDSKWTTQPLKTFLEQELLEMAISDLDEKSENKTWKFLSFLSVGIREIPEPREDIIAFIDGYMNFSTLLEPKSPNAYLQERSYTNGSVSFTAKQSTMEEAGDYLDKKLKELQTERLRRKQSPQTEADIQVKAKMPSAEKLESKTE